MTLRKELGIGSFRSVAPTTSTGAGTSISTPPLTVFGMQVVVNGTGTGTIAIEGSLDGVTWTSVIANTTYANSRHVTGTTGGISTYLRASVVSHNSTKDVAVWITGK